MKHRIAIIGAGNVGTALGKNWSSKGHTIIYGVTNPDDVKHSRLGSSSVKATHEAARAANVIVIATPWPSTEAACGLSDPSQARRSLTAPTRSRLDPTVSHSQQPLRHQAVNWCRAGARGHCR